MIEGLGQEPHEVENPRLLPLVLAQRFVVDEQMHGVAVARGDPVGVLVDGEGPFPPRPFSEAERDVVAQAVVAGQEAQAGGGDGRVDVIRRAPLQHPIRSFHEHASESHRGDDRRDGIAVDELGVAEDLRADAELVLEDPGVQLDLRTKLLGIDQRAQGVVVGLAEQLDATSRHQFSEGVERLRGVRGELLDEHAGEAQRDAEPAVRAADKIGEKAARRDVALRRDTLDDAPVCGIVEIVVATADVEDPEATQPVGLMNLTIDRYVRHQWLLTAPTSARW